MIIRLPDREMEDNIDPERAKRLDAARRALGYETAAKFCRATDFLKQPKWTNYIKYGTRPELNVAIKLCQKFDELTLDFIYLGSFRGMSTEFQLKIREEMARGLDR